MKLTQPVALVGLCRTPIGKVAGMLAPVEPHALQAHVFRAAHRRALEAGIPEAALVPDEIIVGNLRNSVGNIARVAALEAGLPESVPAITVDRQCASSMEALALAAGKIAAGLADLLLVGGVESASQAPWLFAKTARPFAYAEPRPFTVRMAAPPAHDLPMGETAELLADDHAITRADMDAFALESHRKAAAAADSGAFAPEIEPLANPTPKASPAVLDRDECIRPDTSASALAKLRPAFRPDGRVTAGNSSPINDGAAAAWVLSPEAVRRHGVPMGAPGTAWITGVATVGLDPRRMGLGPALAIPRLLAAHNLRPGDIDLFEVNEAFAAQVLACMARLEADGCALPPERLNVHGGAIALGHPLGATGLRLVVTLAHALAARGLRRGVASLCVGGGQGMAVLVERTLA
jgi:acetyl-CoA acetyltransferase family protein